MPRSTVLRVQILKRMSLFFEVRHRVAGLSASRAAMAPCRQSTAAPGKQGGRHAPREREGEGETQGETDCQLPLDYLRLKRRRRERRGHPVSLCRDSGGGGSSRRTGTGEGRREGGREGAIEAQKSVIREEHCICSLRRSSVIKGERVAPDSK